MSSCDLSSSPLATLTASVIITLTDSDNLQASNHYFSTTKTVMMYQLTSGYVILIHVRQTVALLLYHPYHCMVLLLAVCCVTVQRVPIFEALPYMPQRVWGRGI